MRTYSYSPVLNKHTPRIDIQPKKKKGHSPKSLFELLVIRTQPANLGVCNPLFLIQDWHHRLTVLRGNVKAKERIDLLRARALETNFSMHGAPADQSWIVLDVERWKGGLQCLVAGAVRAVWCEEESAGRHHAECILNVEHRVFKRILEIGFRHVENWGLGGRHLEYRVSSSGPIAALSERRADAEGLKIFRSL